MADTARLRIGIGEDATAAIAASPLLSSARCGGWLIGNRGGTMRRYIILASALIGVAALLLWWMLQPPPGVELKGPQETAATVTLITGIVGLLTSVVTLITTLVKSRRGDS